MKPIAQLLALLLLIGCERESPPEIQAGQMISPALHADCISVAAATLSADQAFALRGVTPMIQDSGGGSLLVTWHQFGDLRRQCAVRVQYHPESSTWTPSAPEFKEWQIPPKGAFSADPVPTLP